MSETTRAVVLGAGMAGMLAATTLARHVDEVTVLDRDRLPGRADPRRGVPQARHTHVLWSGGARVIESLLPGTTDRLLDAGAHRIGLPEDLVSLTAYGWQRRFPETQFMLAASRSLLDWTVRDQAGANPRITVTGDTDVIGLRGDAAAVTGVTYKPRREGTVSVLDADVVVDATGRGSPVKRWLAGLGLPPVQEDVIDSGMAYATRVFRAPSGARKKFPLVSVYADHRAGVPGRNGILLPIEDGRWMVTLSGTRGGEPPTTEDGFTAYLRTLRHPLIADLVERAEPLTGVQASRSTANRRLYYDRLVEWPDGLVMLGDAVAAFNPVYGHGMSAAALSAAALGTTLAERGLRPGTAQAVQRAVGAVVDTPWSLGTSQDICYPDVLADTDDPRLTRHATQRRAQADLIGAAALADAAVCAAAMRVNTLSGVVDDAFQAPEVRAALASAATLDLPAGPTLSDDEYGAARTVVPAGH